MTDYADLLAIPEVKSIFEALENKPKLKVDLSLMDEVIEAVSVAKKFREKAESMRLPKRYKTEDDLHALAEFLTESQAKRDRVIEIKLEHMPLKRTLDKLWERALGTLYEVDEIAKMSPAPRRDATLNNLLAPLRDRISKVALIIEAASEADRHLGNVYFTLKELKAIATTYIEGQRAQKGV